MRSKAVFWGTLSVALVAIGVAFLVHAQRLATVKQTAKGGPEPGSSQTQAGAAPERVGNAPAFEGNTCRLEFSNEREGWIYDTQRAWRTTDAGQSWQMLQGPWSGDPIWQLQFISGSEGWLLAGGLLHRTVDGGQTWTIVNQPIGPNPLGKLANFRFAEGGRTGWALGGAYRNILPSDETGPSARYARHGFENQGLASVLFVTQNSGKAWRKEQLPSSRWGYLWNIFVLDADHAWVTGIPGAFYLDNGRWREMNQGGENEYGDAGVMALNRAPGGPDDEPSCAFFLDKDRGWISNFNGYVARSIDGGRTWADVFKFDDGSQTLSYFWNLYFSDSNDGWALSYQGDLYQTRDGGSHWSTLSLGVKATGMAFLRPDYGLVLANEGLFRLKQ